MDIPDWSSWEVMRCVVIDGMGLVVTKELKMSRTAVAMTVTTTITITTNVTEEGWSF